MAAVVVGVAALGLVTSISRGASTPPLVISGDSNVGGLHGQVTPAGVTAKFGRATTTRSKATTSCVKNWTQIGLTINFIELSGNNPCVHGVMLRATITSRHRWRTAVGLRIGDPVTRLRRLYPSSRFHHVVSAAHEGNTGYWLITRHTCAEVGGYAYPSLLARARGGVVRALVVQGAACE